MWVSKSIPSALALLGLVAFARSSRHAVPGATVVRSRLRLTSAPLRAFRRGGWPEADWGFFMGRAGVYVRMRAHGRASIKALMQGDPYIIVSATEYRDEERSAGDSDAGIMEQLADDIFSLHADVVELTTSLDKDPATAGASDVAWGHEKTNTSHCFRSDLREQVRQHQAALAEGGFLQEGGESGGGAGEGYLWGVESAQLEELQLLSFVALAGLEPEVRFPLIGPFFFHSFPTSQYLYNYTSSRS